MEKMSTTVARKKAAKRKAKLRASDIINRSFCESEHVTRGIDHERARLEKKEEIHLRLEEENNNNGGGEEDPIAKDNVSRATRRD